jgi:hypothetical protein
MKVWVEVAPGRSRLVDTDERPEALRVAAPFVRQERLTAKSRKKLKMQLGRDFDSESQLRAYMRDNGMRFIDNGEKCDDVRRKRKDWLRNTKPGERGKNPFVGPMGYGHA